MIEKQLRRYILPNVLAMVGMSCYFLADTFFISKAAGTDGITALNLALPIFALIYAIGAMIGIGSATRYAIEKAHNEQCDDYFSDSVIWVLMASLPFVLAGIFCPGLVLEIMGADNDILDVGYRYIRIVLLCTPLFMINYVFTAFVRNDNAPKTAMCATLFSGLFNIIFDYTLMFPFKMGMPGAALATGLSPLVSMIICLFHFFSKENTIRFMIKLPSLKKLIRSCQLGIAAFIGEISSGITTAVFNFILLGLSGNSAVAAYGITANTALVGTALLNGISQGLQPMASEAFGKSDKEAQNRILKHSLLIAVIISSALIAAIMIFAEFIVGIFNSDNSTELAEYASIGIRLYFIGFIFASANIVYAGYYAAIGNGFLSTVIAVSRGIVSITIFAFLLSCIFGMTGVWLSFSVSELFTFILELVLGHYLKKFRWGTKDHKTC